MEGVKLCRPQEGSPSQWPDWAHRQTNQPSSKTCCTFGLQFQPFDGNNIPKFLQPWWKIMNHEIETLKKSVCFRMHIFDSCGQVILRLRLRLNNCFYHLTKRNQLFSIFFSFYQSGKTGLIWIPGFCCNINLQYTDKTLSQYINNSGNRV